MGRDDEDAAALDSTDGDPAGGEVADRADDAGGEGGPDAVGGDEDAQPDERIGGGFFEEEIGPGSAMAHLYRGEVHRMTIWRERLDRSTRWAVVVLAAVLTWAFSSAANPHYVILVGVAIVGIFCGIEAHRYRGYDVWRSRVRTLQVNAFAYALDPSVGVDDPDWREKLARDYREPTIKITFEEAFAHRLRRVYYPLALVLLAAWVVRVTAFAGTPWPESATVGRIPGVAVTALVGIVYLAAGVVAYRPRSWRARGELREEDLRSE